MQKESFKFQKLSDFVFDKKNIKILWIYLKEKLIKMI